MTSKRIVVLSALNLQLFADGTGTTAGAPASTNVAAGNSTGENTSTASNPIEDKATAETKVIYGKQETIPVSEERKSFEDLVKSDEYKDEAKAYYDKVFSRRMKKSQDTISGLESQNEKMRAILEMQNVRYGLNPESETYLDDFASKVQGDTKLYEEEALEAGMKVEDYMKLKQAEQVIERNKRDEANREAQELISSHVQRLSEEAQQLKTEFPNFDIEAELQNPKFKKLVDPPEFGGSGISVKDAFYAIHHKDILKSYAQNAVNQATTQVANSIAINKARPAENGLSKSTPITVKDDPSTYTLEDFKRIRDEFHRTGYRPKF